MKTILIILALLLVGCSPVPAQKYRVRAVQDSVFVVDTLCSDCQLKVWSPYVKDFLLTLVNPNGYVVDVLEPSRPSWKRGNEMQGWYFYELIWFDFRGKRATKSGKVLVL